MHQGREGTSALQFAQLTTSAEAAREERELLMRFARFGMTPWASIAESCPLDCAIAYRRASTLRVETRDDRRVVCGDPVPFTEGTLTVIQRTDHELVLAHPGFPGGTLRIAGVALITGEYPFRSGHDIAPVGIPKRA